jgi:transcriptional regulator with XRE-family HTH domain
MVGLRRTYLSRVENDHVMPGPRIVVQIARALGVEIQDLLLPQPERGSNGAVLREPTCARLVALFSELEPREMAAILATARQMLARKVSRAA